MNNSIEREMKVDAIFLAMLLMVIDGLDDGKVTKQSDHFLFLSPAQTASPVRKGRKGKAIPAEVEAAVAEKEEVVKEKEVVKVEKKGGRKVKLAPAIVEIAKEEEVISWMNDNA